MLAVIFENDFDFCWTPKTFCSMNSTQKKQSSCSIFNPSLSLATVIGFPSFLSLIFYQVNGKITSLHAFVCVRNQNYLLLDQITLRFYVIIKIMRFRSSVHEKNYTGDLNVPQPVTLAVMKNRVNAIKFRTSSKSFSIKHSQTDIQPQKQSRLPRKTVQAESDIVMTNFYPGKPQVSLVANTMKVPEREFVLQKRSQDSRITRPQSHSLQARSRFRILKNGKKQNRGVDALTYIKEVKYFAKLYELLGNVLASIRSGLEDMEKAVSEYGKFIRDPYLNFIDQFSQGRLQKIKRSIRLSRIHEYLSIAYLFLEIAQGRMENNQSYLVNFIGYSLSNLIFVARIYILTERRPQFEDNQFERSVQQFEISSYGHALTSLDDVLLRIQHNNETIMIIHRKLGVQNQKFQQCVKTFLKNAERKKYTTCLCAHYIFEYLAMHIHETELVGISQFLQVSPTPYLAPPQHDYTLVFEPLGIIKNNQHLRPYLMQFVKWASKYFDLVLWSWEMPSQLENLLELLDPYLASKLYRYHCVIKDGIYTKDLNRLGRDLKKTLIIDFDERIYATTPKNGFVARWRNKMKDKGLLIISEILEQMVRSQSEVQQMLTFYAEEIYSVRES